MGPGRINPNFYRKTTPQEDQFIKANLDNQLGSKGTWHLFGNTCRDYSQREFKKFDDMGIGTKAVPPVRQTTTPQYSPALVSSSAVASSPVTTSEPYSPSSTSTRATKSKK